MSNSTSFLSPSILSPSLLSPTVNIHFHGHLDNSCNNCFPPSPKRIIALNDLTLTLDNRSKIASCLTKFLCCSKSLDTPEQNKKAVVLYEKFLIQEYGSSIASLAIRMAHIDLSQKKTDGSPLLNTEAAAIAKVADQIVVHRDTLKKMLKHLAFYIETAKGKKEEDLPAIMGGDTHSPSFSRRRPHKEKGEVQMGPYEKLEVYDETDLPDSPLSVRSGNSSAKGRNSPSDITAIFVQKRDGRVETFQQEKISKDLKELPLEKKLSDKAIKRILKDVKSYLTGNNAQHVSSDTLRTILAKALETKGARIPRPEFLDQIPSKGMVENLEKRRGIEDISPEECEALLIIAGSQENIALSEYPLKQPRNSEEDL
ncbi:MAG: hypothetical protein JSS60_07010 [Verrucomicrobia bacterium]|nr:hypothetical protein [Verrucomicrobiota bacterium]